MRNKNKARKSTGTRVLLNTSTPLPSQNQPQRGRGSTLTNNSIALGDSSDSDVPTQRLRSRNQNTFATPASTPGPSGLQNNSRVIADGSDDDDQTTLKFPNDRRKQNSTSKSDSDSTSDSDDDVPGRHFINKRKTPVKNASSKKQKRREPDSESHEEESNQTVQSSSKEVVELRSIPSLVNKCVYYLLIADQKKHPIKRADITKHVFMQPERKFYAEVLNRAGDVLKKTYGLELITYEKNKSEYMLINHLSPDLGIQEFIDYSPAELQKRGFIFYILTIIFMNQQCITEDELEKALKPLGVDLKARLPHPLFGNVHKYITSELVKQTYLNYKTICDDPPQYELTWGERAYQEVDKKDLLEFACKIMGDTKPEEWVLQYNDAMGGTPDQA